MVFGTRCSPMTGRKLLGLLWTLHPDLQQLPSPAGQQGDTYPCMERYVYIYIGIYIYRYIYIYT